MFELAAIFSVCIFGVYQISRKIQPLYRYIFTRINPRRWAVLGIKFRQVANERNATKTARQSVGRLLNEIKSDSFIKIQRTRQNRKRAGSITENGTKFVPATCM